MYSNAVAHLGQYDEALRPLLHNIVLEKPTLNTDIYAALLRAIAYQQLSGKAAATIFGRFLNLFENQKPDATHLANMTLETLRSVGLSAQKANYMQNVAKFHLQHDISSNRNWADYTDDEILALLTQIKGVGKWTVQMVLMFQLGRLDVFPIDDLGIQNGMIKLYNLQNIDNKSLKIKMQRIAEAWRPFRSVASFYIWRWKDGGDFEF